MEVSNQLQRAGSDRLHYLALDEGIGDALISTE